MRDCMKERLHLLTIDELALLLVVTRQASRAPDMVTSVVTSQWPAMDRLIELGFLSEPTPPSCGFRWAGLTGW